MIVHRTADGIVVTGKTVRFTILVALTKVALTPFSLAVLVGLLCVARVLKR